MNHRTSLRILRIGMIVSLILLMFGYMVVEFTYSIGLLGLAVLAASMIQARFYLKCPHCGEHLSTKKGAPDVCPECGRDIDW